MRLDRYQVIYTNLLTGEKLMDLIPAKDLTDLKFKFSCRHPYCRLETYKNLGKGY